jgi:hypothetical protein
MEVISELDGIIEKMLSMPHKCNAKAEKLKETTETDRIAVMKNDLKETKDALKGIIPIMNKKKTWAQVAAQVSIPGQGNSFESTKRERLEKHRMERTKTEVIVTTHNASEHMKKKLADMNEKEITKGIQDAIQHVGIEPSTVHAVKRTLNQRLKVQCSSEKDAEKLHKLD